MSETAPCLIVAFILMYTQPQNNKIIKSDGSNKSHNVWPGIHWKMVRIVLQEIEETCPYTCFDS